MLLCDFCEKRYECDYYPIDDDCAFGEGLGDDKVVMEYAQNNGLSITDAIMLISFCCGLRL